MLNRIAWIGLGCRARSCTSMRLRADKSVGSHHLQGRGGNAQDQGAAQDNLNRQRAETTAEHAREFRASATQPSRHCRL